MPTRLGWTPVEDPPDAAALALGADVGAEEPPEEQAVMTSDAATIASTAIVSLGRVQTIAACFQS
jgi:hypothetical protein